MIGADLLHVVRNYLDITWVDPQGDEKLLGIIGRGIAYVNRIAGREQNFDAPGAAQGLLLNYCMYERANQLSDFQKNYLHELNALQLDEGVAMFAETETADI